MLPGTKLSDVDEFNNFEAPMSNVPMPRWERKALEASQRANRADTAITPRSTKRSKTPSADRFIPNRRAMDLDLCRLTLTFDTGKENGSSAASAAALAAAKAAAATNSNSPSSRAARDAHANSLKSQQSAEYNSALASMLLDTGTPATSLESSNAHTSADLAASRILTFKDKAPEPKEGYQNANRVLYSQNTSGSSVRRNKFRHIPQQPEKILDAPSLLEDFYLNLVDWGSNNTLAVALAETVYLWNAETGSIASLCETSAFDDCVTSVSWMPDGNHLAVGTNRHEVQIWDAEKMSCVRKMRSHSGRVGALAWNGHMLSSGSRDSQIHNHDVRIPQHHIATLAAHTQEVCGLKWSPNGTQLASGGNDNLVCIWDQQTRATSWTPKFQFDHHTAAVKALAWCPWQTNLLSTGGGTADRHLRFWNTATGTCVNSIDTKSQVCSIVWSPHDKELVTSHGFSQNQLTVWKYPTLARMAELKGHTSRVLHMALSPDGQTVVSGAADETLRFWKVFANHEGGRSARGGLSGKADLPSSSRSLMRGVNIR